MENMNQNRIKLEESTLPYALNMVAAGLGRRLTPEEINEIMNDGLKVSFRGGAPMMIKNEDYAIFPSQNRGGTPRLKVECYFSPSGHMGLVDRGNSIVGGTLFGGRFGYLSSTWSTKKATPGSPEYDLGVAINRAMLNHFRLKH